MFAKLMMIMLRAGENESSYGGGSLSLQRRSPTSPSLNSSASGTNISAESNIPSCDDAGALIHPRPFTAAEIPVSMSSAELPLYRSDSKSVCEQIMQDSTLSDNNSMQEASLGRMQASISAAQAILPPLQDAHKSDIQDLLLQKISVCCTLFDFTHPTKDATQKQVKQETLLELKEYMCTCVPGSLKHITSVSALFEMFSTNIFRPLPSNVHDHDACEIYREPCWSHLELVYDILTIYVNGIHGDHKSYTTHIDELFIRRLLDRFDSADSSERMSLKIILHDIYAKLTGYRCFIRKEMRNIFYQFVMETRMHNGIAELLDVYGSVISGFSVPIRMEHREFMLRALIPLHKTDCMAKYFVQLSFCTTQFVLRDLTLADVVIVRLLKYWPKTSSEKEILFLQEVEALLEITRPPEFQRLIIPLFRQLVHCLNSPHFRVVEYTLWLWKNDAITHLISQNRQDILPLIIGALEKNMCRQWDLTIKGLTSDVKKIFVDLDNELFQVCLKNYTAKEETDRTAHEQRVNRLKQLEEFVNTRSVRDRKCD